jgi:hypothetical protein
MALIVHQESPLAFRLALPIFCISAEFLDVSDFYPYLFFSQAYKGIFLDKSA